MTFSLHSRETDELYETCISYLSVAADDSYNRPPYIEKLSLPLPHSEKVKQALTFHFYSLSNCLRRWIIYMDSYIIMLFESNFKASNIVRY